MAAAAAAYEPKQEVVDGQTKVIDAASARQMQTPPVAWTPKSQIMELNIRRQIPGKLHKQPKQIWLYWSSFFGHQLVPTFEEENTFLYLLFNIMLSENYKLVQTAGTFPPEYRFEAFPPETKLSIVRQELEKAGITP